MVNINESYGRDLDLNLLRIFTIVAEESSLTRAAARLYVTQPAVSAAMRRLARVVGNEQVTRQGHAMKLTSRGADLLAAARTHLQPLIAAALAAPVFDPARSIAIVRFGIADGLEAAFLPPLLARMRDQAPHMQLVVLPVQFRTVEQLLLANQIDFAVTVADELPRSILRQPLAMPHHGPGGFVCLYDPRFVDLPSPLSERAYFAQDHVIVSYAGDTRGIIEDALGKARTVRASVPGFGYVADVVDGATLVATVPALFARHVVRTRPHLHLAPLPFALPSAGLELVWSRVSDEHAPTRFVRGLVAAVAAVAPEPPRALRRRTTRRRSRRARCVAPPLRAGRAWSRC